MFPTERETMCIDAAAPQEGTSCSAPRVWAGLGDRPPENWECKGDMAAARWGALSGAPPPGEAGSLARAQMHRCHSLSEGRQ